jgi:hypothetical protein
MEGCTKWHCVVVSQTSSRHPHDVLAGTRKGGTSCFLKLRVRCVAYFLLLGPFLGSFAEFVKATVSFVMSVRPFVCSSVSMEQIGSHGTDFHYI